MSDVATARRMIDAWNEGNVDRMVDFWAEDGAWRWEDAPDVPGSKVVEGREAVEAHLREVLELLGNLQMVVERIEQAGDDVLIATSTAIHGVQSGVDLDSRWGHIVTFEDGRVRRYRVFVDPDKPFEGHGS